MKKNSPFYIALSHLATWLVLFLLPMTFRSLEFPQSLVPTAAVIAMFYLNYLWLTPRFYMQGQKSLCWIINLVLLIGSAWGMHQWLGVGRGYIFNLGVAVIIAISMKLGSLWQQSEEIKLAAEAAQTDAELRNLRYQTNPHFLLNTLNNIYALTAFDTKRAQEAIQQLSGMLRHILYDNMEQEVQLEDEVKFLQNYISLMKIRQPETVEVNLDTQQVVPQVKIAPLILIPLVENAFKHGVSPTQKSIINIRLKADTQRIEFCIENSNHPKTSNDQSGHGIGLTQVQRRLQLAYPGRHTWKYGPSEDKETYSSQIIIQLKD